MISILVSLTGSSHIIFQEIILGSLIGFTNLGEMNSHLQAYERSLKGEDEVQPPLANSMLVFLVKGLFGNLQFPYVQFPCTAVSGDQMYDPFCMSLPPMVQSTRC